MDSNDGTSGATLLLTTTLLHMLLPDVGVNWSGGAALMAEQNLDNHLFHPSVKQVRGIAAPQLMRSNFII